MPGTIIAPRKVDYASWIARVFTWDCLLPAFVVFVPILLAFFLPNAGFAIEIAAVFLPVTCFTIRLIAGTRFIMANYCRNSFKTIQFICFFPGIIVLVFIDSFLIISHLMPKGAPIASETDIIVLSVLYSVYLISMTIAMYPGRMKQ